MEYHPLANLFPLIDGQPYADLMADIKRHGVREPVWTYQGQILDGRNRWRAANAVSVACPTREFTGEDPAQFVVSLNLHRRHLSESQRAMVAAKLADMPTHRPAENCANLRTSQTDAAELLNVSRRTLQTAAKVQQEAPQSVVQAVEQGSVSVSLAAQVVALPEPEREAAAAAVEAEPEKAREVLREAVRAHVANNSGNNEWYTPAPIIEAARQAMGQIDVDPASSEIANRTVKAEKFYTAEQDGLKQEWRGQVWMNPPYAQPLIADFASTLAAKYRAGEVSEACVLVNNGTETAWFQTLLDVSSAVCLIKTRVKFIDPEGKPSGAPLQGQAVIFLGDEPSRFSEAFSTFGKVLYA